MKKDDPSLPSLGFLNMSQERPSQQFQESDSKFLEKKAAPSTTRKQANSVIEVKSEMAKILQIHQRLNNNQYGPLIGTESAAKERDMYSQLELTRKRKGLFPAASLQQEFNTQSVGIRHAIDQSFKVTDYVHERSSGVGRSSTSHLEQFSNGQAAAK